MSPGQYSKHCQYCIAAKLYYSYHQLYGVSVVSSPLTTAIICVVYNASQRDMYPINMHTSRGGYTLCTLYPQHHLRIDLDTREICASMLKRVGKIQRSIPCAKLFKTIAPLPNKLMQNVMSLDILGHVRAISS
jgi:hypothetical protein